MPPAPVTEHRPPPAVRAVLNPVVRTLIGSPAGRLITPLVVLRFTGRRSGRAYAIVTGWHAVGGARVVFSPALWRLNFRGGRPVTVVHGGRRLAGTGTLVEDAEVVAAALQEALDAGSTPTLLGLRIEAGHRVTPDDVRAVGRDMIRLDLADG
jgi:hypothetical protein